jgi:FKBP-type peptidyl-prolyl cis-trans isomerase FklB
MQLMHEGDMWELYIPSDLAYGDSQRGQYITPGSVLVFKLEMLKIKGATRDDL